MHLKLGELSTVIISSEETAKEVLKTHELSFAQRPPMMTSETQSYNYSGLIFTPYGNYWREMRKICMSELLSNKQVQSFRSIREEEVRSLVQSIALLKGQPVNLSGMIYGVMNDITARAVFGEKCEEQKEFILCVDELTKLSVGFMIADLFPSLRFIGSITGKRSALVTIHQKIDKILQRIIDNHIENQKLSRTASHAKDLVHVLLDLEESNNFQVQISKNHIKAVLKDIFVAGSDTSATTTEWIMSELVKNPKVMAKAQAEVRRVFEDKKSLNETDLHELDYLKLVIKEGLRLHPAAPLIRRELITGKINISGYEIPEKTSVTINVWALGRDPRKWTEPDLFKPERFEDSSVDYKGTNFDFIPFGSGRRMCPGISFGIAQVELVVAHLLYYFDWKPANGCEFEELDMVEEMGATVKRKNGLELIATPYISVFD